jgi:hypothetical protein
MKKTSTLVALLCLLLNLAKSQVIFFEDFESDFEPNSWITNPIWKIGTTSTLSSSAFPIPVHTQFAGVNDDWPGAGVPSFGSLVTKAIDLNGVPAALLHFDAYFINGDYDADETFKVLISTDGMQNWGILYEVQGNNSWQPIIINLGDAFADQIIHLAFEYNDNNGWNYGCAIDNVKLEFTPEYAGVVNFSTGLEYTISTPRQLNGQPLHLVHNIQNYGTQPLNDISFSLKTIISGQGTVGLDSHLVNVPIGASVLDTFSFLPTMLSKHSLIFNASHGELGTDFYQTTLPNAFELSDSVMAKDDGGRDVSIGMSFGNPIWYGYYGSEFDLTVPDTLTGISVWMATSTAGSFNLKVNKKDATGSPNIELFHSNPIEISAGFNNWVYFPMPLDMPLPAGNYVFAVGQDTIQGVMGHGFDSDRTNPGYWIVSPVAGGGYPWSNWPNGQTLMLRPHFKQQQVISGVKEHTLTDVKIYPNPTSSYLYFDIENNPSYPLQITLTNAAGLVVFSQKSISNELNINHLLPGLYFLKIQTGERLAIARVIKQ